MNPNCPENNTTIKECRICFEDTLPLIKPCQCEGTMSSIHPQCLTKWRKSFFQDKMKNILEQEPVFAGYIHMCREPLFHHIGDKQYNFENVQHLQLEMSQHKHIIKSMLTIQQRSFNHIYEDYLKCINEFCDIERNDYFSCPTCKTCYKIEYNNIPEKYSLFTNNYEEGCDNYIISFYAILMAVSSFIGQLFLTWFFSLLLNTNNIDYTPFTIFSVIENDDCSKNINFHIFYTLDIIQKTYIGFYFMKKVSNEVHQKKLYYSLFYPYLLLYLWSILYYPIMFFMFNNCDNIHTAIWLQYPFCIVYTFMIYNYHERIITKINDDIEYKYIECI